MTDILIKEEFTNSTVPNTVPTTVTVACNSNIIAVIEVKKPINNDIILVEPRSAAAHKLVQCQSHMSLHHQFYFTRMVRLWKYLPVIDISRPPEIIKNQLVKYLWHNF